MRKFKHGFLLTLLVGIVYILAVGTVASAATVEVTIGDYVLQYDDTATATPIPATIKSYTGTDVDVSIPATMVDISVTPNVTYAIIGVGDSAFLNNNTMQTLTIAEGILTIDNNAFCSAVGDAANGALTSVGLPDSLTSIGNSAFAGHSGITAFTIPANVTIIGDYVFDNCFGLETISVNGGTSFSSENGVLFNYDKTQLIRCPIAITGTSYTMPETVETLADQSFYNCDGLTEINLSSSLLSVSDGAFLNCDGLTSMIIPSAVTTIGLNAFTDCINMTDIFIPKSVTSIDASAFSGLQVTGYRDSYAQTYAGTNSNTFRAVFTFDGATQTITNYYGQGGAEEIPAQIEGADVLNLAANLFKDNTALTSISLPSTITSIGTGVFEGCSELISISVDAANASYSSADGVLFNKNKTSLIYYPAKKTATSYTVADTVTTIADKAFYMTGDCNLDKITIGNNVTSISDDTFANLIAANIPDIYGYTGSEAESFANRNGYNFVTMADPTPTPAPTVNPYPTATPTTEPLTINFSGWAMYSQIVHQQPYYLGGTIESNLPFTLVRVKVVNGSGVTEIDKYENVNVTQYSMSDMNDIVHMETLSVGNKTLYFYITNGLGEYEVYSADFSVVSSVTPAPTVNPYPTASPTATPIPLTVSFSGWSMYSKIIYEQPFYLGGKIESNFPFTLVRVKIVNDKGSAEIDKSQVVNVTTYSMSGMNSLVKMETLELGKKTIYIYISDASGEHTVYSAGFEVVKASTSSDSGSSSSTDSSSTTSTPTATASVSFSGWSMADSILEGTKYYMWGTISASEKMESLSGKIVNSAGTTISEKSVSVNSKTYELGDKSGNLSSKVSFSSLDPGRYDLIIKASFTNGSKTVYKKSFTVVKKTNLGTIDTMVINKSMFGKGEDIKLEWEKCLNADSYELVFTLNGTQIKKEVTKDTSFTASFDKVGSYSAFITAKNENGTKGGNYVYFYVNDASEYKAVTAITISGDNYSINITDRVKLTYSITPADASRKFVTWKSEDPDIASIDMNGYLTANRRGKTTITAVSPDGVTSNEYSITVVDSELNMPRFANEDTIKLLDSPEAGADTIGAVAQGQELIINEIRISDDNAQYWAYVQSGEKEGWVLYSMLSEILSNLSGANGTNVSQAILPYPGGSYISCYAMLLNNMGIESSAMKVYKQNGYTTDANHELIAERNGFGYVLIADNAITIKEAGASLPDDLREKIISAYDEYPMGVIVNFVGADGTAHAMLAVGYDSNTVYFLDPAQRSDSSKPFEDTVVFNRSISSYSISTLK